MPIYSKNMTKPLIVNIISETEFSVKGHGVHTAYIEMRDGLQRRPDIELHINDKQVKADIIHIHTMGTFAWKFLNKPNGKKVVSGHLVPDSFIGSIVGAKYWRPLGAWWLKRFYGRADLVLACSGMVKDELINNMKLTNTDVLYNSIDTSKYRFSDAERAQARQELQIQPEQFVIIGNGQVQPRKRFDILVEMAKKMPDVRFFWVGGIPFKNLGADHKAMEQLIQSAPDNMTVTGVIPLEQVKKYYAVADLFILPAEQENHPMCVIEAAASGLPIILRDIPNYHDTFGQDVLLAKTDADFYELAQQVINDDQLRRDYQAKSALIAKRFDVETAIDKLMVFYQQLLNSDQEK